VIYKYKKKFSNKKIFLQKVINNFRDRISDFWINKQKNEKWQKQNLPILLQLSVLNRKEKDLEFIQKTKTPKVNILSITKNLMLAKVDNGSTQLKKDDQ